MARLRIVHPDNIKPVGKLKRSRHIRQKYLFLTLFLISLGGNIWQLLIHLHR